MAATAAIGEAAAAAVVAKLPCPAELSVGLAKGLEPVACEDEVGEVGLRNGSTSSPDAEEVTPAVGASRGTAVIVPPVCAVRIDAESSAPALPAVV